MNKEACKTKIKTALGIVDSSKDLLIEDIYQNAVNYMNVSELPDALESFIRGKVKRVIDYEASLGSGVALDVASQTEGKCSWTYNINDDNCREAVYGFGPADFRQLRCFRRTRK